MKIAEILEKIGYKDAIFSVSSVSDVFKYALENNIKKIFACKTEFVDEYQIIQTYMIYSGQWDWDKKTFMGIKILKND